jgi:hypothetical protein
MFISSGMATGRTVPNLQTAQTTVSLMDALFGPTHGIGGSSYFKINTTYSDTAGYATENIALLASSTNNYSRGKQRADSDIQNIVSSGREFRVLYQILWLAQQQHYRGN